MHEKPNPRMKILPETPYCVDCINSAHKKYRLGGETVYLMSGSCLFDRYLNEDKKSPFIFREIKERMFGTYDRMFFDSNLVTFKEKETQGKHNCLHLGYSGLSFIHDDEITFISHAGQRQRLDLKKGIVERKGREIPWNEFVERVQRQNFGLEKIDLKENSMGYFICKFDPEGWIEVLKTGHIEFPEILDMYL